jgi:hypothetical protein
LVTATQLSEPEWIRVTLVIASIINVPMFLFCLFLLQTKFRPEMQEDTYYSKYLESKTANTERIINPESFASLREDIGNLKNTISEKVSDVISQTEIKKAKWSSVTVSVNKALGNFSDIVKFLSAYNVPVHETFGGGASKPDVFSVALGSGFDVNQIKDIVNALSGISDGWISYADNEGTEDEYYKKVLIGAYGSYEHGIELKSIKPILERPDITATEVYKIIGR